MPRLLACPAVGCGGANFADFRSCQWCGSPRVRIPTSIASQISTSEKDITGRREALMSDAQSKTHAQSKCKELASLGRFLLGRQSILLRRSSVFQAIPGDIVDFLVFRDLSGDGRTTVHVHSCVERPHSGCGCPVRLSAESFRGIASKLKTGFQELGLRAAWNAITGEGNPADSGIVELAVKTFREEQAKAGVSVMSARRRALLPQKLELLMKNLEAKASVAFQVAVENRARFSEPIKLAPFLRILQDSAWFAIQFRSLNRGSELSNLRVGGTVFGPNKCCVGFQFSFSKVMRDGSSHEFGVSARENDITCPVLNFTRYVTASKSFFQWDWESHVGAFVFDSFSKNGVRSGNPVSAGAMAQRFKAYLVEFEMNDSASLGVLESLHGLRAGGALVLALEGKSLADIMSQGFWKSPQTAIHYIGMLECVIGDEFMDRLRTCDLVRVREFLIKKDQRGRPRPSYLR